MGNWIQYPNIYNLKLKHLPRLLAAVSISCRALHFNSEPFKTTSTGNDRLKIQDVLTWNYIPKRCSEGFPFPHLEAIRRCFGTRPSSDKKKQGVQHGRKELLECGNPKNKHPQWRFIIGYTIIIYPFSGSYFVIWCIMIYPMWDGFRICFTTL